jgi:tetratricopeptide (TPR) repeat protein/tRNA A-37 threonylcarbamoyl transferase component Bud32
MDGAWERVKRIFQDALDLSSEARPAFLDEACGGDVALRREVESMLTAHDEAGAFLEQPAIPTDGGAVSWVGRRIGPYRIVGELGRGGMGTVFRAVRDDDAFRKEVALKLVRSGLESRLVVRRFRRERQILARLQHPNIAALYDGGATEDGQPYLVMEAVEGQPIDPWCEARGPATRGRLELFRVVCAAVQYAHRNLVVHRDIKPGNILVTPEGVPKLLDFGIARLLGPDVDAEAAPTATLLPMLTPEYASPEQVRGEPVTTSSDVYSLGVVLYELLTGRRPYEVATGSVEEIVRVVCVTEPERPSTVVRRGGPATRPRVQAAELRGDLDTIVLKCLRKETERRYASVQELSEDLRRHLEGLPVVARPDTLGYRAVKFVGRHRLGVAALTVAMLGLVTGTAVALRQARIAEANRQRAERRFNDVRKLAGSLLFDLHDEIASLPGSTRARQHLVMKAEEYLDSLAREAHGDADLQRELAAAYERLGDVQGGGLESNLGDTKGALASYRKAVSVREALGKTEPRNPRDVLALAHLQMQLATVLGAMGDFAGSERTFQSVTTSLEALLAAGQPRPSLSGPLANSYQKLANLQSQLREHDAMALSVRKAIEYGEELARDHPKDAAAHLTLAGAYFEDGQRLADAGRHEEALKRLRQARAIDEDLILKDPLNTRHRRLLGFTLNSEARTLEALGRREEALDVLRQAVAGAEEMSRNDPQDKWAQASVVVAQSSLGRSLVDAGKAAEALTPLRSGRSIAGRLVAADPANGFVRNELAVLELNLGRALLAGGRAADREEACRSLDDAKATWTLMQTRGTPEDSADGLKLVEELHASCP